MIVKEIFIYPVKGMKGISVSTCKVTELGLANDRIYMLADRQGQLISQRTHTELALMKVSRVDSTWEINYKKENYVIEDGTMSDDTMDVDVWGAIFKCNEVSRSASDWFAKQLGTPCKLMVMPHKKTRLKEIIKPPFKTYVSFADGYPVTILGTKSIELLNQKLEQPIKPNRFRPNLIIETITPHEEDMWEDIRIGDQVKLRTIKPCVRCQVISIDQELGVVSKEPLKTLASYREKDNGVCFASNVITLEGGEISVGDSIQLI